MLGFLGQMITVGAHAVGLATHVAPARQGESLTEVYLTQPAVSVHASFGPFSVMGMVNFEGLTLDRGELSPGVWGEGYVDRRHPHTYLHEAIVSYERGFLGARVSLSAGRGFAPYGTDDPMVRHFVKYPSNHHLSQILERPVVIAALQRGGVVVEGGVFSGVEPINPEDFGDVGKFGDSWSARVTYRPRPWLETQVSYASAESPENEFGAGLDHQQWNVSARVERPIGNKELYVLIEGGELSEADEESTLFFFHTFLGEALITSGDWQFGARFERSERPEEERMLDIFRTPRPASHFSILGITRWTTGTLQINRRVQAAQFSFRPFLEVARYVATPLEEPAILDPDNLYGDSRLWSFSVGIRSTLGSWHTRMGRYGAARLPETVHHH